MKAYIRSISSYTPPNRVSNEELCKTVDSTDDWIVSHTGIKFRHIADKNIATSDLALEASKKVLAQAGISPEDIDLIMLATATQDYPGFPSTPSVPQLHFCWLSAGRE